MLFKVKLWGVRGSLPSPYSPEYLSSKLEKVLDLFFANGYSQKKDIESFLATVDLKNLRGFGGNTSCVEVMTAQRLADKQILIIDGGSGIRRLGEQLMAGPCGKGQGRVDILMTHFHWDHLIGLPFFTPLFVPGNEIHFYAVQENLEECIRQVFTKPYFPVPFDKLASRSFFHRLEPRVPIDFGDLRVTPYQLDHPDPCWGYRIEKGGKVFSYCVDTEGTRSSRKDLGEDLALYQNVDLMVFDAQYTLFEMVEKIDWGHGSAPIGLDIALREGVKRILFAHHDPAATDEKIAFAEKQTRDYFAAYSENLQKKGLVVPSLSWEFAREGMEIEL